ncbi:DedA family protein [Pseudofrancisella aestuarii]|uniref:DedA family protein n=1 Tax=Pseudofrancisella aestuarii TaxID=2670347 RepID=A0ABV9TAS9_9GAMM|nr:DedA family protein [Pseudofrancisella aestuarii]
MDLFTVLLDIILHLDQHISTYINLLGNWSYVLLFIVIFCETGLVVTPFLPGDSLLFAIGLTAAATTLNVHLIAPLLVIAAILGDSCNYLIGRYIGKKIFKPDAKVLKTKHLDKTQAFFNKYGGRAIILARFMPLIRTFMPFVAGMSRMNYPKFVALGVIAAIIWVYSVTYTAFIFSNNDFVRHNFGLFIMVIIVVSLIPAAISILKALITYIKDRK